MRTKAVPMVALAFSVALVISAVSSGVLASPPPQVTPTPEPGQASEGLEFHMSYPPGWEVEVAGPRDAQFTREDEGGIFVTHLEGLAPGTPVDVLLALAVHELGREFLRYADLALVGDGLDGELNGWPAAESYFEASVDTDEGPMDVQGRVVIVAGADAVYMVLGAVELGYLDTWWQPVMDSMDSFQPVPGPAAAFQIYESPDMGFRMQYPQEWDLEVFSPVEVEFYGDEALIYVELLDFLDEDVAGGATAEELLDLMTEELEGTFDSYQELLRQSTTVNGWPAAEAYYEGTTEDSDGPGEIQVRFLVVVGEGRAFLLVGDVDKDAVDRWWQPVMDSMDSFQPEVADDEIPERPMPGEGNLAVTEVISASAVWACDGYQEREDATFFQGERMYILLEVVGTEFELETETYHGTLVVTDFVLRDPQGNLAVETYDMDPLQLTGREEFTTVCLWLWVDLHLEHPPGDGTAEITIVDEVGQQAVSVTVPFTVVEWQSR